MWFPSQSWHDIYRCTTCKKGVSHGDKFCKHCGHQFTALDIAQMKKGKWYLNIGDYAVLAAPVGLAVLALSILFYS